MLQHFKMNHYKTNSFRKQDNIYTILHIDDCNLSLVLSIFTKVSSSGLHADHDTWLSKERFSQPWVALSQFNPWLMTFAPSDPQALVSGANTISCHHDFGNSGNLLTVLATFAIFITHMILKRNRYINTGWRRSFRYDHGEKGGRKSLSPQFTANRHLIHTYSHTMVMTPFTVILQS